MYKPQLLSRSRRLASGWMFEEIIGTAYLAAVYLKQLGFKEKVYIVGPQAIEDELRHFSIDGFGCGPDIMLTDVRTYQRTTKLKDNIGAVIVGYDEHISYPKMAKAFTYLQNPQCLFIATNNDPTKKTMNSGVKVPGAGCMVEALTASAMRAPISIGKPDIFMQKTILCNPLVKPNRTLMIGDKPSTDILLGKRCGFQTMMVLSGSTTLEQVQQWKASGNQKFQELVPDYYIPLLGHLLPWLNKMTALN